MNITQYRNKLKKYWDLDFAVWKERCFIIYKWVAIMSCDRVKNDQYNIGLEFEKMLINEIKYSDSLIDPYTILTIILHPIRSYRRYKLYNTI